MWSYLIVCNFITMEPIFVACNARHSHLFITIETLTEMTHTYEHSVEVKIKIYCII